MKMRKSWLIVLVFSLLITACGGRARAGSDGDPEAGKALFQQTTIHDAPACSTCHSTEPGKVIVGPSLAGIASRAGSRKEGFTAEAYIRQSILEPNAYIVDGFPSGVMYQKFKDILTEEELSNLAAYLLTLQ
jgi:mono/diheme cytochrome c family protein